MKFMSAQITGIARASFESLTPGMFFAAAIDHKFRLDHSIYVGDDIRDAVAAKSAGCKCVLMSSGELIEDVGVRVESIGQTFMDLVPTIINEYESWEK